jgi:hypothetical protein
VSKVSGIRSGRLGDHAELQAGDRGQRVDEVLLEGRSDTLLDGVTARYLVDIEESHDGAVDAVVGGLVGPCLHLVPVPLLVLQVALLQRPRGDHLAQQRLQVG